MSDQEAVAIYNLALEELGQAPIEDFEEDSPAAESASERYEQTVKFLRDLRVWSFDKTVKQLSRLETAPDTGYAYQFEIPGGQMVLSIARSLAEIDRPMKEGWRIYEGRVHSNEETLWAEVRRESQPGDWPGLFKQLVVKAIAEAICMQHTGNIGLKRDLREEAYGTPREYPRGGLVKEATAADSQADPDDPVDVHFGPLIGARF